MRSLTRSLVAYSFALLAITSVVAGCSSGSDSSTADKKSTTSTSSMTPTTEKKVVKAEYREFCGAFAKMSAVDIETPGGEAPETVKAHYRKLLEAAKGVQRVAPDDIKDAVTLGIRYTQEVVDSGSTKSFESVEAKANGAKLQKYVADHC